MTVVSEENTQVNEYKITQMTTELQQVLINYAQWKWLKND